MNVGFIGLGSMGLGMAKNLLQANHIVRGFDILEVASQELVKAGGIACSTARDTTEQTDVLILMVVNGEQTQDVLFTQGVADALPSGAVVLLCPTILPKDVKKISEYLIAKGLMVIDCPVSGGKTGADSGNLSLFASGEDCAFEKAKPVLDAISKTVYRLGKEPGIGSTYKIVHQLLAGVHLAVTGEVMAFGVRAGCDPKTLYDIVRHSAGQSWMFCDRVPYLLKEDYAPRSAIDIFVKDMNLVLKTGDDVCMPLPLASVAQQLFIAASSAGYGQLNDTAIVKVFEDLTGVNVAHGISGREEK